jgi:hypothetical protein
MALRWGALDGVEVGRPPHPEHADQFVLTAVEAALTGIGFDPGNQIEHRAVDGGAGGNEFANMAPVHADKVDRTIDRNRTRARERVGEKIRESGSYSLFLRTNSLFLHKNSLFCCVGNFTASHWFCWCPVPQIRVGTPNFAKFPVNFPVSREFVC